MSEFESLTRRITKHDLGSRKELGKMAELLAQAESSHKRFIERLRALIGTIDEVRARQNASAAALSQCAERLEAQRGVYATLEQRFAEIGETAREVNTQVQAGVQAKSEADLRAASERLGQSIEAARTLMQDAKSAGLSDLEQQADSLRQQLQALAKQLERLQSAL